MTDPSLIFGEHELLLTGANGFLGKVILGLLLDRFPGLKHVHILQRSRGGLSAAERFRDEVLGSPALARIVEDRGDTLNSKISVWEGDIALPDCGLSSDALHKMSGRVNLILNCAGRVDFFPPVDESFSSNVDGVESVLAVARRLHACLLHVSTCFVCGEAEGLIEESEPVLGFYPHRRGPEDDNFNAVEELARCREFIRQIYTSEDQSGGASGRSRELAQRLVALGKQRAASWGWVNTYTYSKSLGEQTIAANPDVPFALVRPAIVESAWQFPFPGWIEGGRTAAPLVLMALGGLKDWPVLEEAPLEVIPVDMVAAAILIIAALLLDGRHASVYQLASADTNPVTFGETVKLLDTEARRRKNGAARSGGLAGSLAGVRHSRRVRFMTEEEVRERRTKLQARTGRSQRRMASAKSVVQKMHLPGARWLDACLADLRKMDLQASFREQTLGQYLPFVLDNRYTFECENIRRGREMLTASGRDRLSWRPESIDWKEYWTQNQIGGIEKWVQPAAVRDWTFKI